MNKLIIFVFLVVQKFCLKNVPVAVLEHYKWMLAANNNDVTTVLLSFLHW